MILLYEQTPQCRIRNPLNSDKQSLCLSVFDLFGQYLTHLFCIFCSISNKSFTDAVQEEDCRPAELEPIPRAYKDGIAPVPKAPFSFR